MDVFSSDAVLLAVIGLVAGGITTLAGLGGGLVMTLILAALWGPGVALATAAPALLVGNVQRVWLFREHVSTAGSTVLIGAAVPGALVGAALTTALPELALRILFVGAAVFAVAREVGLFSWRPGPKSQAPVAFSVGFLTATSGGGGLLLGPLLLASGYRGEAFVAMASLVALSVHIARMIGYGAGGLISEATLMASGVVALFILIGNLLGRRGRNTMSDAQGTVLTYTVLLGCVALSVFGLN